MVQAAVSHYSMWRFLTYKYAWLSCFIIFQCFSHFYTIPPPRVLGAGGDIIPPFLLSSTQTSEVGEAERCWSPWKFCDWAGIWTQSAWTSAQVPVHQPSWLLWLELQAQILCISAELPSGLIERQAGRFCPLGTGVDGHCQALVDGFFHGKTWRLYFARKMLSNSTNVGTVYFQVVSWLKVLKGWLVNSFSFSHHVSLCSLIAVQ